MFVVFRSGARSLFSSQARNPQPAAGPAASRTAAAPAGRTAAPAPAVILRPPVLQLWLPGDKRAQAIEKLDQGTGSCRIQIQKSTKCCLVLKILPRGEWYFFRGGPNCHPPCKC